MIYHTGLRLLTGIALDGNRAFVSIAYCPWCAAKVTEVEDSLIGRPMVEGSIGPT